VWECASERDLDLDNDGIPEVHADATNADQENAVKTWAADGDNLVVYLVGHGGGGAFRGFSMMVFGSTSVVVPA